MKGRRELKMPSPACQNRASRRRGEILIPFGETAAKQLIHISQVVVGGAGCGCHCPACREPLLAYIRGTRAKHFAHKANGKCTHAYETSLHRFAKEVVERSNGITCPAVVVDDGSGPVELYKGTWVRLQDARLEHRFHGIIPDLLATVAEGTKTLLIEIEVTHAADDRKRRILDQQEIAAIEIDLSGLSRQEEPEELERLILHQAPRSWLYNPHVAGADSTREQRARLHAEQNAAPVLAMLERTAVAGNPPEAMARRLRNAVRELGMMELLQLIGLPVGDTRALAVSDQDWQAFVLRDLLDQYGTQPSQPGSVQIARLLQESGLVRSQVARLTDRGAQVVRERVPGFLTPEAAAAAYLIRLVAAGFLDARGRTQAVLLKQVHEKFIRARQAAAQAAERRRREEEERKKAAEAEAAAKAAKEREEAARKVREQTRSQGLARLRQAVEPIVARVSETARGRFLFEQWITVPLEFQAPEDHMMSPGSADRFIEKLSGLMQLFDPGAEPAKSLLGLPLEEVQALRVAEQKVVREAQRQQLFTERLEQFRLKFPELADDAKWMSSWPREFYGHTPGDGLAGTEDEVRQVYGLAAREMRDRQSRAQRAERLCAWLRTLAVAKVGDALGNAWMDSTSRMLRAWPARHCRDDATYSACVRALANDLGIKLSEREKQLPR